MGKKSEKNGKSGKNGKNGGNDDGPQISREAYEDTLYHLQIELVKLQRHFIQSGDKILVIFEGRDAAGKDGTIKRIIEHLSPRETRWASPPTGIGAHGISSATCRICQRLKSLCCSIAVGTTGRAWSP